MSHGVRIYSSLVPVLRRTVPGLLFLTVACTGEPERVDETDTDPVVDTDTDVDTGETDPPIADVAWWALDEGAGAIAADRVGEVDGALVGAAAWTGGARQGTHALLLDGVSTPAPALEVDGFDEGEAFSLSLWFRTDRLASASENAVLARRVHSEAPHASWDVLLRSDDRVAVRAYDSGGVEVAVVTAAAPTPEGRWTHLGVVRTEAELALYVDGVLQGSAPSAGERFAADGPLVFGGRGTRRLQGALDDVCLSTRPWTAEDMAARFAGEVVDGCGGPDVRPPGVVVTDPGTEDAGRFSFAVRTDEAASCRWDVEPLPFEAMAESMGGDGHDHEGSVAVEAGTERIVYVHCADAADNATEEPVELAFSRAPESLDPAGCTPRSDAELRDLGFEAVTAHGAIPDDGLDDTEAIQAAIDAALVERHVVYFRPGVYDVSDTLHGEQEEYDTPGNDADDRHGNVLLGSYCGTGKPTLRMADGVDDGRSLASIARDPTPVILLTRTSPADYSDPFTHSPHDWNQIVRNLRIETGRNSGVVGIRHMGAEGSSSQEVTIDATGGFAGLYHINCSGGYTYDVEVTGGRFGIYSPFSRGGSCNLYGVRLVDQEDTPIAVSHYTPLLLVGFDIRHDDGLVVSAIQGSSPYGATGSLLQTQGHDSGGHLSLVDGRIEVDPGTPALFRNNNRALYLKDVYVLGASRVAQNQDSGAHLAVEDPTTWTRVGEYAYAHAYADTLGEPSKLLGGDNTDDTYLDGTRVASGRAPAPLEAHEDPPEDLVSRHLYPRGLCNVEGADVVVATDDLDPTDGVPGADPDDGVDDTEALQASIDFASEHGLRLFLPGGRVDATSKDVQPYRVSSTLELPAGLHLCGTSKSAATLSAVGWVPSTDAPVLRTVDDADAAIVLADFNVFTPARAFSGTFLPMVYALHWRAGRNAVQRDVWYHYAFGNPHRRKMVRVTDSGGGRWWGTLGHGAYPPRWANGSGGSSWSFYDADDNLVLSPESRLYSIEGTSEPFVLYSFHAQHTLPPRGAQVEITDAEHITVYGIKQESAATGAHIEAVIHDNVAEDVPIWLAMSGSDDVTFLSYESLSEMAEGRGVFEFVDSTNVTVAMMGRRDRTPAVPESRWYFVKSTDGAGDVHVITAEGVMGLYKSDP